ncbi:tautomerase family protein [Phaeovulum sp. W22_SRMD_FR3]|uniref:tautomerase family protein n=1 Tax=Phaeovulum sp. W22_SRMD_FR3 TaxID=3240274 RepID=UPI003F9E6994
MPFIEVIDPASAQQIREVATERMTHALCRAYGIKPEIVTCYYFSAPNYSYGHAGKHGENAEKFRIFIKVHAFPRAQNLKERAASDITDAVSDAYGVDAKSVVLYFFDTQQSDAFHAGVAAT